MTSFYIDENIKQTRRLYADILQLDKSDITINHFISMQAERLFQAHSSGDSAVVFQLTCWCKTLIGKSAQEIMSAPLTLQYAQQAIAAEHGFGTWRCVENLADKAFDVHFEHCVDHMLHGELNRLQDALAKQPALATQTSQYGHRATLLHYLAANGVETYRQVTPMNAADIAQTLVDAGADPSAQANMYGGSDVLSLLHSSAHPANAGVVQSVSAVLANAIK